VHGGNATSVRAWPGSQPCHRFRCDLGMLAALARTVSALPPTATTAVASSSSRHRTVARQRVAGGRHILHHSELVSRGRNDSTHAGGDAAASGRRIARASRLSASEPPPRVSCSRPSASPDVYQRTVLVLRETLDRLRSLAPNRPVAGHVGSDRPCCAAAAATRGATDIQSGPRLVRLIALACGRRSSGNSGLGPAPGRMAGRGGMFGSGSEPATGPGVPHWAYRRVERTSRRGASSSRRRRWRTTSAPLATVLRSSSGLRNCASSPRRRPRTAVLHDALRRGRQGAGGRATPGLDGRGLADGCARTGSVG
jgi:hypothetical protein